MIRSSAEFDRTQEKLFIVLKEVGLEAASTAYLVFGDYDFIVRIWASQLRCRIFETRLFDLKQAKEIKLWKRLFISTLNTWIQRNIEHAWSKTESLTSDAFRLIWEGKPSANLQLTLAKPPLEQPFRFFMFVEESFDADPKVFRLLRDLLTSSASSSPYRHLSTWSIYSYYVEPQEAENIRSERGVLFTGQVGLLRDSSNSLVKVPRTLSEAAAKEEIHRNAHPQANPEFLYRSVTYICAKEIKSHQGALHIYEEKEVVRKKQILRDLFVSHDNHDYKYLEGDNRRKVQERFIEVAFAIEPFELYFRTIFITFPRLPDWWRTVSEVRLIYKFFVFGRNELFLQLLIKKYIFIETFLLPLCLKPGRPSVLFKKIIGIVQSTLGANASVKELTDLEEKLKAAVGQHPSLGDLPGMIQDIRKRGTESGIIDQGNAKLLVDFSKRIEALGVYRNKIFHGEWQDVIRGDGRQPTNEDYYWVPIVSNYLFVSFALTEVVVLLDRVVKGVRS